LAEVSAPIGRSLFCSPSKSPFICQPSGWLTKKKARRSDTAVAETRNAIVDFNKATLTEVTVRVANFLERYQPVKQKLSVRIASGGAARRSVLR
jgi:hypothetical protein